MYCALVPNPRACHQTLLPTACWCQSPKEKTTYPSVVKHWKKQHFNSIEKRQSKISFSSMYWLPMASVSLPEADAGKFAYTHPFYSTVEEPRLLPSEDRYNSGVVWMP